MPPKKTMKKVIQKTTLKPTTARKGYIQEDSLATKASEIADIFSTWNHQGIVHQSHQGRQHHRRRARGSKGSIQEKAGKTKGYRPPPKSKGDKKKKKEAEAEKSESEGEEDFIPLDDEDEEEVDDELRNRTRSEEAAIAKLLAKKKSKSTREVLRAKGKAQAAATGITTTKVTAQKSQSGPKVEAVWCLDERPAAACSKHAAAAKIQKFKRVRRMARDSDDELGKEGKRRTDDGRSSV
ncbi:MAG: hypothetical protein JOS17DRAFT_769430 [Linnemannia elongata]|nr:MAG: hypothetical protein JOS17DRAFT_769430 [Linnemannia elongata]